MQVISRNQKQFEQENKNSHRFTQFNEGSIHYVVKSLHQENPVLIFSHGSPGTWDAYAHLMNDAELSERFTMISYDRPGFGKTTPKKPVKSLKDQAAVIKSILSKEQITSKIYLLGHSYGGPVVQRFANDYPDQTAGLALIASPADPILEKPFWYNKVASWKLIRWMIPKSMRYSNDEIMPLGNELAQMHTIWNNADLKISVVHGKKDKLVPFEHTNLLEEKMESQIVYRKYSDADHFVLWTDIATMKEAILAPVE